MAEPTASLSYRDLTLEVATRKYMGILNVRDWPTETEIATATWAGHTTAQIDQAVIYLNDAKSIADAAYKRILAAHTWGFLTKRTTLTGWVTNTETAVGVPTYADPVSTIVVDADLFLPSMVGSVITFGTSETTWTIAEYVSATSARVTGDASGEVATQEITITSTGYQRLPDDFSGEVVDEKFYRNPDSNGPAIDETTMSEILTKRGLTDLTHQNPWQYGLETVQTGGFTRWNVCFWPGWSTDTLLHYRYKVQIDLLTSASVDGDDVTDYPLGGANFSTAIREACMAILEENRGYDKGPAHTTYNNELAIAIRQDGKNKPANQGYNKDDSDRSAYPRRHEPGTVTYQ